MALTVQAIEQLFVERGDEQYTGEPVTQLQHALQTAQQAEAEGADDALVTAALLHDLGHLLHDLGATPTLQGVDDVHQYRAPAVPARPVRRRRAAADPAARGCQALSLRHPAAYHAALSDDSRRSLALQGGVFDPARAEAFIDQPGASEAVRLRIWDDLAKDALRTTPPLAHYLPRARRCALPSERSPGRWCWRCWAARCCTRAGTRW
jgi:predicted HD phosphohydrolase